MWSGRVYVATENDTVYALSSSTGALVWSTHLGRPVPAGSLPCGDITPNVGITGTPVIDQSRGEIFVVADELVSGKPAHMLVGLSTTSGKSEVTQDVDPAGANTAALLQRTGLTLDAGQVVFGFGGNYGDCSTYRGWLVAVNEAGGMPKLFAVDAAAGESQGAIWMGGAAPAVDSSGHLWVSVGNGSVTSSTHAYDNSDSVLELSSSLQLLQFFAPSTWASNNANDLDMSTEPALLSDGQVVVAGKSRSVYLLNGAHLGGIGGQQAVLPAVCSNDIDGGIAAVVGTTVYLPCRSGIIAVQAARSPAALRLLWSSGAGGGPAHRRGGPGLDHRAERHAVRSRSRYGQGAAAGIDRRARQPFSDSERRRGLLLAPSGEHVVAFTTSASGGSARSAAQPGPSAGQATKPAGQTRDDVSWHHSWHCCRRSRGDRRDRLAGLATTGRQRPLAELSAAVSSTHPSRVAARASCARSCCWQEWPIRGRPWRADSRAARRGTATG